MGKLLNSSAVPGCQKTLCSLPKPTIGLSGLRLALIQNRGFLHITISDTLTNTAFLRRSWEMVVGT